MDTDEKYCFTLQLYYYQNMNRARRLFMVEICRGGVDLSGCDAVVIPEALKKFEWNKDMTGAVVTAEKALKAWEATAEYYGDDADVEITWVETGGIGHEGEPLKKWEVMKVAEDLDKMPMGIVDDDDDGDTDDDGFYIIDDADDDDLEDWLDDDEEWDDDDEY